MALIGLSVSEEKMSENCGWTDGRRTQEHGYIISSPCEPDSSGELIIVIAYLNISLTILNHVLSNYDNMDPSGIESNYITQRQALDDEIMLIYLHKI